VLVRFSEREPTHQALDRNSRASLRRRRELRCECNRGDSAVQGVLPAALRGIWAFASAEGQTRIRYRSLRAKMPGSRVCCGSDAKGDLRVGGGGRPRELGQSPANPSGRAGRPRARRRTGEHVALTVTLASASRTGDEARCGERFRPQTSWRVHAGTARGGPARGDTDRVVIWVTRCRTDGPFRDAVFGRVPGAVSNA